MTRDRTAMSMAFVALARDNVERLQWRSEQKNVKLIRRSGQIQDAVQ